MNDNCVVDVEFVCLECIYMSMFGVCTKLMENDVVVVKLWMISWFNVVVVVVMECVVDELMHRVFIIVDCDVNWLVVESFGETLLDCWIMLKWCFNFKFCATLSIFWVHILVNNLWERFRMLGDQNLGFWVKNGWNP